MNYLDLKPGDKVATIRYQLGGRTNGIRVYTVERLTATQYVMTDGTRFKRANGYRVGGSDRIYPLINLVVVRAFQRSVYEKARDAVRSFELSWREDPSEGIRAMQNILADAEKEIEAGPS